MANSDDDDDEDTYVTIGTPFEIPEENEPLKKPSKVEGQVVVDKQGRRRFHGAFTGGFSAGYFNTVGSKEGWTPSTFVSSRSNRQENNEKTVFKPEDFMDEEDFTEHGIAPRKLKTTSTFESTENELAKRKRHIQKVVDDGEIHSAIPGGLPMDQFVLPAKLSIGIKLLKKMGWKPGQGIGEKVDSLADTFDTTLTKKKIYGCSMPPQRDTDSMDMKTFQDLLAPKDVQPFLFARKDNMHGVGYSGIDPTTAVFGGVTSKPKLFRPTGKEKRGIRGQAFGVGAFEEEDDDIYSHDNISNYDLTMGDEENNSTFGWSGAPKSHVYKGCLTGFAKASQKLVVPKAPPMISLQTGYIPKHVFLEDIKKENELVEGNNEARHKLSSKERSILLGETTKGLESVKPWTLKWDKHPEVNQKESELKETTEGTKQNKKRFSSRWDNQIHQERPKQKLLKETQPTKEKSLREGPSTSANNAAPVYDPHTGVFKPFAKFPEKQARYEQFLAAKRAGNKLDLAYDRSVTEWEREREMEEFSRAAVLYRPLATTIATRFTRATMATTNIEDNSTATETKSEEKADDKKAAELGMFGKLTRTVLEWHPDKTLCKRFNIANPYPLSNIKGVPGRGKKTNTFFTDASFGTNLDMIENTGAEKADAEEEEEDLPRLLKKRGKGISKGKINIGPLSHLNKQLGSENYIEQGVQTISSATKESEDEETTKPSIDIFKAIFDDSDSSSSSSDEEQKKEDEMEAQAVTSSQDSPKKTVVEDTEVTQNNINVDNSQSVEANSPKLIVKKAEKVLPLEFLNSKSVTENSVSFDMKHARSGMNEKIKQKGSEINDNRTEGECIHTASIITKNETNEERSETVVNKARLSKTSNGNDREKSVHKHTEKTKSQSNTGSRKKCVGTSGNDSWEEESSNSKYFSKHKLKKTKKEKKVKKHKKEKYDSESEDDDKERGKQKHRKSKKHKKEKKKKAVSTSSSDDETIIPSNIELLEKLKQYSKSIKRPSAADFM